MERPANPASPVCRNPRRVVPTRSKSPRTGLKAWAMLGVRGGVLMRVVAG
jgi:hypothetical protein